MLLSNFFKNAPNIEIKQLSCDSRIQMKDCIYFCIRGIKYNGHNFINEAIENGAKVIVYSEDIRTDKNAIFIKVNNVEDVLNQVSSKFYDYPASKLDSYVVCGTNGRSSVTSVLNHVLSTKLNTASIGVLGIDYNNTHLYSIEPTLPILDTQKYLVEFVKAECNTCTFEATSLSLSYKKIDMLKPKAFIYTHTNRDDADYKELGLDYYDSIKRYLYTLDDTTLVVLNRDDSTYEELYRAAGINKVSYGFLPGADYLISDVTCTNLKTTFSIKHNNYKYLVNSNLLGTVNVYNLTAALATLNQMGINMDELIKLVNDLDYVDGVYERLNFDDYNIFIDCAYSNESIYNILDYANKITPKTNRIICIQSINTTDNENRLKVVIPTIDNLSDLIILTENDSYEDDIQDDLNIASSYITKHNYLIIENREGAIEEAVELMNKGDTLIILGKGNENFMYQGLVKKSYYGDKNLAYKYMHKRLKEETIDYDDEY